MTAQSRSWNEMFDSTEFSIPQDQDVWVKRLETNGLYYMINYLIISFIFLFVTYITDKSCILLNILFIFNHASLKKRSIKSKFNHYKHKG